MMKFKTQLSLFVVLFLFAFSLNAKPLPSLSLKMNWLDTFVYDQPVKIQVHVMSQINSEQVNINLFLPAGVVLLDGEKSLQRKIERGQTLLLEYTVLIENKAIGEIQAEASMGGVQQVFFRAADRLSFGETSVSRKIDARTHTPPPFTYTERNGVKLREYKLD